MSTAVAVYHGKFGRATLYQLNRPMTTHAHREGHVIFHVQGTPGAVDVSGRRYPLTPDEAVAVSPWEPHAFAPGDVGRGALFLVLYINPEWFVGRSGGRSALCFGRTRIEVTDGVARSIETMAHLLMGHPPMERFDGQLFRLTDDCFAQSWKGADTAPPCGQPVAPFSDYRVRKSIRLLAECLGSGSEIRFDAVARESGLSRPHFYKLFRKQTGITPNLYLNTLLMERAIDSLTGSGRSVTDIGFDLGFSSQSGFTRFFISNVGMAPTDYRRAAQVLPI